MKISLCRSASRKRKPSAWLLVAGLCVALFLPACAGRKEFQKGYERGAADTVKRQYWILQNMQKRDADTDSPRRLSLYRVPVEPDPRATVQKVPYEITIPIYQ